MSRIFDFGQKDLFLKIIKINACSSTIYTFGERDREYLFLSQASESLWKCWWKWSYLMLKTKYQANKNSQNLNFYILFLILGFLLTDLPITYKNLIFDLAIFLNEADFKLQQASLQTEFRPCSYHSR